MQQAFACAVQYIKLPCAYQLRSTKIRSSAQLNFTSACITIFCKLILALVTCLLVFFTVCRKKYYASEPLCRNFSQTTFCNLLCLTEHALYSLKEFFNPEEFRFTKCC